MALDTHAHDRPGEPPEIRDEAADTPMWVPALGLALLILGAVGVVWQSATRSEEPPAETAVQAQPDEAPAAEGEAPTPSEPAD